MDSKALVGYPLSAHIGDALPDFFVCFDWLSVILPELVKGVGQARLRYPLTPQYRRLRRSMRPPCLRQFIDTESSVITIIYSQALPIETMVSAMTCLLSSQNALATHKLVTDSL